MPLLVRDRHLDQLLVASDVNVVNANGIGRANGTDNGHFFQQQLRLIGNGKQ